MVPPVPMEGFTKDGAVVLRQVESDNTQLARWLVRCACGAEFVKRGSDIRRGQYLRCRSCANRHLAELSRTHGETDGYLMVARENMLKRCYSDTYEGPKTTPVEASPFMSPGATRTRPLPLTSAGRLANALRKRIRSTASTTMATMSLATSDGLQDLSRCGTDARLLNGRGKVTDQGRLHP